jgi:hypothetical protein
MDGLPHRRHHPEHAVVRVRISAAESVYEPLKFSSTTMALVGAHVALSDHTPRPLVLGGTEY